MGFTLFLHCKGNEIRCTGKGIRSLGLEKINSLLKANLIILLQINQISETTKEIRNKHFTKSDSLGALISIAVRL